MSRCHQPRIICTVSTSAVVWGRQLVVTLILIVFHPLLCHCHQPHTDTTYLSPAGTPAKRIIHCHSGLYHYLPCHLPLDILGLLALLWNHVSGSDRLSGQDLASRSGQYSTSTCTRCARTCLLLLAPGLCDYHSFTDLWSFCESDEVLGSDCLPVPVAPSGVLPHRALFLASGRLAGEVRHLLWSCAVLCCTV